LTWINKTGEFCGKECWRQGKIPELRFPVITISIIALNVLAFMRELIGGDDFVTQWSVIPADIVAGRHLLTVLTSMVMHASWSHIIGNMIVGRRPGDRRRHEPLAFRNLLSCLRDSLDVRADCSRSRIHHPQSECERSDSCCDGRFSGHLSFGWFAEVTFIPAALLIGLWFVIQLLDFGVIADVQSGGVAYLAHIGGMIFGAVTARLFEDQRRLARQPVDFDQTYDA
jgi:membrane associated rhomboid family serine protease